MSEAPLNVPLAKKHQGMKANGRAYLTRNGRGFTHMRNEMYANLDEMARRFYSGDLTAVDEFLQVYCIGVEHRKKLE